MSAFSHRPDGRLDIPVIFVARLLPQIRGYLDELAAFEPGLGETVRAVFLAAAPDPAQPDVREATLTLSVDEACRLLAIHDALYQPWDDFVVTEREDLIGSVMADVCADLDLPGGVQLGLRSKAKRRVAAWRRDHPGPAANEGDRAVFPPTAMSVGNGRTFDGGGTFTVFGPVLEFTPEAAGAAWKAHRISKHTDFLEVVADGLPPERIRVLAMPHPTTPPVELDRAELRPKASPKWRAIAEGFVRSTIETQAKWRAHMAAQRAAAPPGPAVP